MSNVEKITELGATGWVELVIVAFAAFFLIVELAKGSDVLKGRFGFWESKTSRRIGKIEEQLSQMAKDMGDLDKKIDDTRTEFNDREIEHWGESKVYKDDIYKILGDINKKLDKQDQVGLKKIRHSIVRAGESALEKGYITVRELRSLEEMYEEYVNTYHQNGYVRTLMVKVRALRVVGKLDENDEDIE